MHEASTVWVVGQDRGFHDDVYAWDFQGVFSTRELAVAACRSATYFIAPAVIDQELPDEPVDWDGLVFPYGPVDRQDPAFPLDEKKAD